MGDSMVTEHIGRISAAIRSFRLNPMFAQVQQLNELARSFKMPSVGGQMKFMQDFASKFRHGSVFDRVMVKPVMEPGLITSKTIEHLLPPMRMGRFMEEAARLRHSIQGSSLEHSLRRISLPTQRVSGMLALAMLTDALRALASVVPPGPSLGVDEIGVEDVDDVARKIDEAIPDPVEGESVDSRVESIISAIESIGDTQKERVVWSIVIPVLVGLLIGLVQSAIADPVKQRISIDASIDVNVILDVALRTEIPRLVGDFALVVKELDVRAQPRRDSSRVGVLRIGDVVTVVEKRRRWTLVVCSSTETGDWMRGWVFSRYLHMIR